MSSGEWAYGMDMDAFLERVDTEEEAWAKGVEYATESGQKAFYVGRARDPYSPETFIAVELLEEHVQIQDDYSGDCAEGWQIESRAEAQHELELFLTEWFEKWGAKPSWFMVDDIKTITIEQAKGDNENQ